MGVQDRNVLSISYLTLIILSSPGNSPPMVPILSFFISPRFPCPPLMAQARQFEIISIPFFFLSFGHSTYVIHLSLNLTLYSISTALLCLDSLFLPNITLTYYKWPTAVRLLSC